MDASSEILLIVTNSLPNPGGPFGHALASSDYQVVFARSCQEARQWLRPGQPVAVMVCDLSLADGNWSDLIRYAVEVENSARIVLRTDEADERLWSEALWRGVYDLLIEPFSVEEARRTIEAAGRAAHYPSQRCVAPPKAARCQESGTGAAFTAAGSALHPIAPSPFPAQRTQRSTKHVETRSRESAPRSTKPVVGQERLAAAS